jgi:hypothetical protein
MEKRMSTLNVSRFWPFTPAQPAGTGAQLGRLLYGLFFLAMSLVNLTVTLPNPGLYGDIAGLALLPLYREITLRLVVPHAGLFTGLLIAGEALAGALILGRGRAVRLGLLGTAVFELSIVPAIGWYTLLNLLVVLVPLALLRREYPQGAWAWLLARVRREGGQA